MSKEELIGCYWEKKAQKYSLFVQDDTIEYKLLINGLNVKANKSNK